MSYKDLDKQATDIEEEDVQVFRTNGKDLEMIS